ncbi:hypothetical protein FP677_04785 [Escherichia coli]|nr:hypothetical protein [Escherichia coli]
MNELINGNAIKMTSIEIAELVGSRPDNVKISIERLAKSGVIQLPALQVFEKINNLGLRRSVEAYVFEGEQGKRDSIIVVAQLSPEFTARLVDRWRELEETAVNTNHGIQISFTTKITGRGQQWLTRKLLDNGMLKVTGEAA